MPWFFCRYTPILPLVLINGAEGIGTGWSTSIPNYNPRDLVNNMKRMLNGQEPEEMQPWYRGFSGAIMEVPSKTAGKSYTLNGVVSQVHYTLLARTLAIGTFWCMHNTVGKQSLHTDKGPVH